MSKMQKGFSLIELMIVVAIIGILATVAIPQIQNHITRTKWQDNIAKVQSYKIAVEKCLQNNAGALASCDTAEKVGTSLPAVSGTLASVTQTAATAAIVITGTAAAANCIVTLTPTVTSSAITWAYSNSGANCNKIKTGVGS